MPFSIYSKLATLNGAGPDEVSENSSVYGKIFEFDDDSADELCDEFDTIYMIPEIIELYGGKNRKEKVTQS